MKLNNFNKLFIIWNNKISSKNKLLITTFLFAKYNDPVQN